MKSTNVMPDNNNPVARIIRTITSPIREFIHLQASGGIVLLVMTIVALAWANSDFSSYYFELLKTPLGLQFGSFNIVKTFEHWVNDGLMVIFFFVVGLEIKKEFIMGELADRKRAALPIVAALGGMVVPALIYAFFNAGHTTANGWGIPMATDIAFAVGVLTLLGKRVPFALTVFLLALAIVDDLGAVLVIAFFYTADLSWAALGWASAAVILTILLSIGQVRPRIIYIGLAVAVWFAILKSGVHATIAGVLLGFLTPIRPLIDKDSLRAAGFDLLKKAEDENIAELKAIAHESLSPADAWIRLLHPWVTFIIMPLFALTNAGVRFEEFSLGAFAAAPVSIGIFFGLVAGKPLGIFLFSWISCKLGLAEKPAAVSWLQLLGVAAIAGIGFTMALFIGQLSLTDHTATDYAKLAILLASVASALIGTLILLGVRRSNHGSHRSMTP